MKKLKPYLYSIFIATCVGIAASAAYAQDTTPAPTKKAATAQNINDEQGYKITADYAVFASGFRTLAATANIMEEPDRYATYVTIETDGLLEKLAPWSGILTSTGRFDDVSGARIPNMHSFDNIWRGTNKRTEQHYDNAGQLLEVRTTEDGREDEVIAPDPTLINGTSDILSAALEASRTISESGSCNSSTSVYDGKRRFFLKFKELSHEYIQASKYTSYDGDALKCAVEIIPNGGKWRSKPRGWMSIQEQSKKKGTPPMVWFGRVSGEKENVYIPVKLQVKTSYGTLMLHLKDVTFKPL